MKVCCSHYINMPMQYTAIFTAVKIDYFQMKQEIGCNIISCYLNLLKFLIEMLKETKIRYLC